RRGRAGMPRARGGRSDTAGVAADDLAAPTDITIKPGWKSASGEAAAISRCKGAPVGPQRAAGKRHGCRLRQSLRIGLRPTQIVATQSISTSNGPCQADTQTKLRAGGAGGKKRAENELVGWKIGASVQYTLHLMTRSSDEPAVVKQSFICSSTISACRSIGKRLISPVAGSYGGMFDTKTRSPHRMAMVVGTLRASA